MLDLIERVQSAYNTDYMNRSQIANETCQTDNGAVKFCLFLLISEIFLSKPWNNNDLRIFWYNDILFRGRVSLFDAVILVTVIIIRPDT